MADISWCTPSNHPFLLFYHCIRPCCRCSRACCHPDSYNKTSPTWKEGPDVIIIIIIIQGADVRQHDFSVKELFLQKEESIPPLATTSSAVLGTSVEHLCGEHLSSPASVPAVSTENQPDRPETARVKMTHSANLNNSNKQHAFHLVPINTEQIRKRSDSTPPVFLCKTDADSSWPWS